MRLYIDTLITVVLSGIAFFSPSGLYFLITGERPVGDMVVWLCLLGAPISFTVFTKTINMNFFYKNNNE